MHFLIVFLCLKREEQGKLLSYLCEYVDNNEVIKEKGQKIALIKQKILGKRVGKSLCYAKSTRNSIRKRKKEGCYVGIGSIRTGSLCVFLRSFFCSSFVWKEIEKKKENSLKISRRDSDKGEKNKGKRWVTWSGCWLWGVIGVFFCVFFRLVMVSDLNVDRKPQYFLAYSFELFLPFEKRRIRKRKMSFV